MLGFQVHRAAADLVARSAGASRAVNGASADGGPGGREARRLRGRLRSRRGVAMAFAVFCGSREALLLTVLPTSRSVPRQLARVSVHAPAPRQLVQPRDACPRRRAARGRRRRSTCGPQVTVGWEAVQGTPAAVAMSSCPLPLGGWVFVCHVTSYVQGSWVPRR